MSEAVLRLRRLRGLTQEELAERMGTKQPAIARLERGYENTTLKTLVAAAEALGATVRIDLDPEELVGREPRCARWWERASAPTVAWHALSPSGAPVCVTVSVWSEPAPSAPEPVSTPAYAALAAETFATLPDRATSDWVGALASLTPVTAPDRQDQLRRAAAVFG